MSKPTKINAIASVKDVFGIEVEVFNATLDNGIKGWFIPGQDGNYTELHPERVKHDMFNVINLKNKRVPVEVKRESIKYMNALIRIQ